MVVDSDLGVEMEEGAVVGVGVEVEVEAAVAVVGHKILIPIAHKLPPVT